MGKPWDPDYSPYGNYSGERGSAGQWRASFKNAWNGFFKDEEEAKEFTRGTDPWSILEIEAGSSQEVIKAAYRRLIKIHHPDRPGGTEQKAKQIISAYETLKI